MHAKVGIELLLGLSMSLVTVVKVQAQALRNISVGHQQSLTS